MESDCDTCFAPESDGGTLPEPRVDDLIDYLADPDNINIEGRTQILTSILSRIMCCNFVNAVNGGYVTSFKQYIRDL